ncbi:MAG: hypothetical protein QOF59_2895 [Actinomycetota bacterium]|nr:hypothetical protein [Actinomycetota bacterium]
MCTLLRGIFRRIFDTVFRAGCAGAGGNGVLGAAWGWWRTGFVRSGRRFALGFAGSSPFSDPAAFGVWYGGGSLSDALSAGAAWAGGVRGVSRAVRAVVGAGDGARRGPAGAGRGARAGAYRAGGVAGGDVAAGGSQRHRARVPGHASGWSGADSARSSGRSRAAGQGSAVRGIGCPGSQCAGDDAGGDAPGVAHQRVCDRVASAGEAAGGCAGVRDDERARAARRAGRVPVGSTQPRRAAPYRPQPRRTRIAAPADNTRRQVRPVAGTGAPCSFRSRRVSITRRRSAVRSAATPASSRRAHRTACAAPRAACWCSRRLPAT